MHRVKVESVVKALRILEAHTQGHSRLSLNDLSLETGYTKSTILRQADTLQRYGYLERDLDGYFRLGVQVFVLGRAYSRASSLLELLPSTLRELAKRTGETSAAYKVDGTHRLCLLTIQGEQFIRAAPEAGERMPLYAGASGKVLLAFSDEALFQKVEEATALSPFTESSITNTKKLRKELAFIKRQGYAVSFGERIPMAAACATPVFNGESEIACALSVNGPMERFKKRRIVSLIPILQEEAESLSSRLGYHGEYWKGRNVPKRLINYRLSNE
jgi:IclR family transcriptional regulator, KDG regulon repressor